MRAGNTVLLMAMALGPVSAHALPNPNAFATTTLNTLCSGVELDGNHVTTLAFGDAVISPIESMSLKLNCQPSLSVDALHTLVMSNTHIVETTRPQALQFIEGTLKGHYKVTVAPAEVGSTQIDPEDIVKTNEDGSIVLERTYHEWYIVSALGDADTDELSSHFVYRFIFELNTKGQPVVGMDHFTGIADPGKLALALGGTPQDYESGLYSVQNTKSSLNTCVLMANVDQASNCLSHALTRKSIVKVGPQYQPTLVGQFGFTHDHAPNNNPISWYSNRIDFSQALTELSQSATSLSSQHKLSDETLKIWIDEARTALSAKEPDPVLTAIPETSNSI